MLFRSILFPFSLNLLRFFLFIRSASPFLLIGFGSVSSTDRSVSSTDRSVSSTDRSVMGFFFFSGGRSVVEEELSVVD